MKVNIHQDMIENLPRRTRKALDDLGVTLKIPNKTLLDAMRESSEDPGLFIWMLYTALYRHPPSVSRKKYDMNAMILMSCLVFIDMDECVMTLEKLTQSEVSKPPPPKKPKPKKLIPDVKYGHYLQKFEVPLYSNRPSTSEEKQPEPLPLGNKVKLRSKGSYEKLRKDNSFLEQRKDRNQKEKPKERICTYEFWEPPSSLRNKDPSMIAYVEALKMLKKKAVAKHKSNYSNIQYQIGGVCFVAGVPQYMLQAIAILPTGYIPINGGIIEINGNAIINILGYWKYPKEIKEACDEKCDCIVKWESTVMQYLKTSRCHCGHLYDYYHEGKITEKFFYPPTRHATYYLDEPKVYDLDHTDEFIKTTVQEALLSVEPSAEPSSPTICAAGLKLDELVGAFLADLNDTPLIIPHLPKANLLNSLQEWARKRVKGNLESKDHTQSKFESQKKWIDLQHIDFKVKAAFIPFTHKQLEHMNWSHRRLIQSLFVKLQQDFIDRNRLKLLEQARLWWSTMKNDAYYSKAFLDIFFTYMPGRAKDIFVINPYSSENTPKYGAKTCPLK